MRERRQTSRAISAIAWTYCQGCALSLRPPNGNQFRLSSELSGSVQVSFRCWFRSLFRSEVQLILGFLTKQGTSNFTIFFSLPSCAKVKQIPVDLSVVFYEFPTLLHKKGSATVDSPVEANCARVITIPNKGNLAIYRFFTCFNATKCSRSTQTNAFNFPRRRTRQRTLRRR